MSRLKEKYTKEVAPKLKEEFGITNNMAVPKLAKIVINTGAGDIKDNQAILDKLLEKPDERIFGKPGHLSGNRL